MTARRFFMSTVRQEGGGTGIAPNEIGSVEVWYDASDDAYLDLTGSLVNSWLDRSGNGRNTSYYYEGATKHELLTSGTGGRRSVKMNDSVPWSSAFTLSGLPITIFCVINKGSIERNGGFCGYNIQGDINDYLTLALTDSSTTPKIYYSQRAGGSEFDSVTDSINMPSSPFIMEGLSLAANDYRLSVNNSDYALGTFSQTFKTTTNRFLIGGRRSVGTPPTDRAGSDTEFLELVMFSKQLTTEERAGLNQYFKNKHGF